MFRLSSLCLSSTVTQRGSRDVAAVVNLGPEEGSGMDDSFFNATGESTAGPLRSSTPVTLVEGSLIVTRRPS